MTAKRWVKVVGALGVVLVATMVAGIAVLKSMDFNQFRDAVEKLAEDATGRTLTITGDMTLSVSLSPSLNVSGITMSNASWGAKSPMLVLKNLQAKVNLLSLLSGQVDVETIVLDGLTLVLQTDGKGLANWEFTPDAPSSATSTGGFAFTPRVRDVRLRNVDLTYIDGATGGRFEVLMNTVALQAESFTSPMTAVIDATYNGVNVNARANLGSLQHFIGTEGGSFPVDLNLEAPGLTVAVKGGVDQPQAGMAIQARVKAAVTQMTTLAKLAGMDMPKVKRLDARFDVAGAGTNYTFSAIDVKLGDSDLAGHVNLNMAPPRPRVTGALTAKVLNVDQLAGLEAPKAKGLSSAGPHIAQVASLRPKDTPKALFSNKPLPVAALYGVDLDLIVKIKTVKIRTLGVSAVRAQVQLDAGRLAVSAIKLALDDGRLNGRFVLNGRGKTPSASANLKVRGLDVGTVLKALGQDGLLTLNIDSDLSLTSSGMSVQAMMGGMNGHVRFSGQKGQILDRSLQDVTTGIGSVLPWAGKVDAGLIRCLVGRLPVKNGIVTAETVLMDTPNIGVKVTGNVDFGGERLHLTLMPTAKTTSLASFAVPVRLKGAFSAPYVTVNPEDAVVGTVANIVKAPVGILVDILGGGRSTKGSAAANDPCLQGLSSVKTVPQAPHSSPPPSKKPNAVESFGNTLKGLFGQ